MKKSLITAAMFIAFALISTTASADIIVEGRAVSATHADGNTYITCKKRNSECIRIVSGSAIVSFDNGLQQMYSIDGYDILQETDNGTKVVLYGTE
jgi:hypothetical protein